MYPQQFEEHPVQMDEVSQGHSLHQSMNESIENNLLLEKIQEGISPDIAFSQVLEEFKITSEQHAQNLQNSVLSLKHKTDYIRSDLSSMQTLFDSARAMARNKSKMRDEKHGQTSSSYSRSRYNPSNSKYTPTAFDMKLEQYKKNAEERKSQTRSGSSYGTGNTGDSKNFTALKEKVKSLEVSFNNICLAFQQREQEFEGLKDIIEDNENDQFSFIYMSDEAIRLIREMINNGEENPRPLSQDSQVMGRRAVAHSGSFHSEEISGKFQMREFSPDGTSFDAIKMQDLQRTNELLLKELRAANDKYFNERLEGKKMREELSNLQKEINVIKSRKSPNRVTSVKRDLKEITTENLTLKDRISKLEQECNTLTYYRENMLSSGNNAFSLDNFDPDMRRANQESDLLRNKLESTTIHVKRFLLAMKRLQRGIKNKDPNNKSLKLEFERCKKELEDWCRSLKEEFSSNKSQSRSKERSYSPAGTYSNSRIYSPNSRTPTKVKGSKSKPRSKNTSKSKPGYKSAAGTQNVSKTFASLIQNPKREELDTSNDMNRHGMRQPDFDQRDIKMFSPDHRPEMDINQTAKSQDLSRTTFGMKPSRKQENSDETVNITRVQYESLKVALVQMVESKENDLKVRLNTITDDLNSKTVSLNKMKRSLIDKLKDLDNSLAETNREYQRSLEMDSVLESSHEERGQSHISELLEQKRKLEDLLENSKHNEEIKTREYQDLQLEFKKYKRDFETAQKNYKDVLSKQKAIELENEMKHYEIKELNKAHQDQLKKITDLEQNIITKQEESNSELFETQKKLQAERLKIQDIESQKISTEKELKETILLKENELTLRTSLIEDHKKKEKELMEEISELNIQNKSLSISNINTQLVEQVEATSRGMDFSKTLADDGQGDEYTADKEREKLLLERLKTDPKGGTEELWKKYKASVKELRILQKAKAKLDDNFDEMKEDLENFKQVERESLEKNIQDQVKLVTLEQENAKLTKTLEGLKDNRPTEENAEDKAEIEKLNHEIEKIQKRCNDTSDLHRNLKQKEKKLENTNKEIMHEMQEFKKKNYATENELDQYKQKSENDISRLEFQLSQAEEEKSESKKSEESLQKRCDTMHQQIMKKQSRINELEKSLKEAELNIQALQEDQESLNSELEKVQEELEAKKNEVTEIHESQGQNSEEIQQLNKEYTELEELLEETEKENSQKIEQIENTHQSEMENLIEEYDIKFQKSQEEFDSQLAETSDQQKDLAEKIKIICSKEEEIKDLMTQISSLESEKEELSNDIQALQNQAELSDIKSQELETEKTELKAKMEKLEQENSKNESEMDQLVSLHEELETKLQESKDRI